MEEQPLMSQRASVHYHGDTLRGLFVIGAVVMIIGTSTGANLPLSTLGTVIFAVVLMVVAGATNPEQSWINWVNAVIAVVGAILFGNDAITHYRAVGTLFDMSYLYSEALALLFLVSIYFAIKTVRGMALRPHLS